MTYMVNYEIRYDLLVRHSKVGAYLFIKSDVQARAKLFKNEKKKHLIAAENDKQNP